MHRLWPDLRFTSIIPSPSPHLVCSTLQALGCLVPFLQTYAPCCLPHSPSPSIQMKAGAFYPKMEGIVIEGLRWVWVQVANHLLRFCLPIALTVPISDLSKLLSAKHDELLRSAYAVFTPPYRSKLNVSSNVCRHAHSRILLFTWHIIRECMDTHLHDAGNNGSPG